MRISAECTRYLYGRHTITLPAAPEAELIHARTGNGLMHLRPEHTHIDYNWLPHRSDPWWQIGNLTVRGTRCTTSGAPAAQHAHKGDVLILGMDNAPAWFAQQAHVHQPTVVINIPGVAPPSDAPTPPGLGLEEHRRGMTSATLTASADIEEHDGPMPLDGPRERPRWLTPERIHAIWEFDTLISHSWRFRRCTVSGPESTADGDQGQHAGTLRTTVDPTAPWLATFLREPPSNLIVDTDGWSAQQRAALTPVDYNLTRH